MQTGRYKKIKDQACTMKTSYPTYSTKILRLKLSSRKSQHNRYRTATVQSTTGLNDQT